MAYTTVSDLKTYLGVTGTGDDTLLGDLIDRAQKIIESATDRVFEASADTTRYFDAIDDVQGAVLWFDEDLCAITTVTNGDSVEVASDEYVTQPRNSTPYDSIKLLSSSNKSWTYSTDPENAISVEGKWAFSTSPPDDIVHATVRLAAYLYRQKDNAKELDRTVIAGNATILPANFPSDVMTIIRHYKRLV